MTELPAQKWVEKDRTDDAHLSSCVKVSKKRVRGLKKDLIAKGQGVVGWSENLKMC